MERRILYWAEIKQLQCKNPTRHKSPHPSFSMQLSEVSHVKWAWKWNELYCGLLQMETMRIHSFLSLLLEHVMALTDEGLKNSRCSAATKGISTTPFWKGRTVTSLFASVIGWWSNTDMRGLSGLVANCCFFLGVSNYSGAWPCIILPLTCHVAGAYFPWFSA